jgi:hypothetical protein
MIEIPMIFLSRIWIGRSYIVILRGKHSRVRGCRQKGEKEGEGGESPCRYFCVS